MYRPAGTNDRSIDIMIRVYELRAREWYKMWERKPKEAYQPKLETRSTDGSNLFVVPLKGELFGFGRVEYRPICKNRRQS